MSLISSTVREAVLHGQEFTDVKRADAKSSIRLINRSLHKTTTSTNRAKALFSGSW
jgi:hypothetical protein